jgi:hypothetical protein
MPPNEVALLAHLEGAYVTTTLVTPVEVFCRVHGGEVRFHPVDEVGRSPAHEREEVMRLGVEHSTPDPVWAAASLAGGGGHEVVIESAVKRVFLLRAVVVFGLPSPAPAEMLLGISLPPGTEYGLDRYHPRDLAGDPALRNAAERGLANFVDVAVLLEFANGKRLVVGTDGWSYFVSVAAGEEAERWATECEHIAVTVGRSADGSAHAI